MVSRAKDTHTPNRVIRMGEEWDELAEVAGPRQRALLINDLVRWWLRKPGAKMPPRPPIETSTGDHPDESSASSPRGQ
jgi:hypothetical protein